MGDAYEYSLPGRRPVTLIGLGVVMAFLLIAQAAEAPWYIWALWLWAAAMLGWAIVANPQSGCRIDDAHLHWFSPGTAHAVALSEIEQIELTRWSDAGDTCKIHLKAGETRTLPSSCLPPGDTFRRVLDARGVPVTRQ